MSSSAYELQITDASLCGLQFTGVEPHVLGVYYRALLELGVTYIQVPWDAVELLAQFIEPSRTILRVLTGGSGVPGGYAGYLSAKPGMPGHSICECAWADDPSLYVDEIRRTADDTVFFEDYAAAFSQMVADPCNGFCPRNAGDFGTALAVEWLLAGGCRLTAAFMGVGGYAPLEEVLAALHVRGILPPSVRLENLPGVVEAYQLTKTAIPAHKAVIGSALFDVESGVHVDGIAKNRQCYEPFAPETVGAVRHIVIGKHSGKQALKLKLEELGLQGMFDLDRLLHLVREQSMCEGGGLDDDVFTALAKKTAGGDAA